MSRLMVAVALILATICICAYMYLHVDVGIREHTYLHMHTSTCEHYATKSDKAGAIYDWFKHNRPYSYTKYKHDLDGESNIVEYEDVLAASTARDFSERTVMAVL